MELQILSSRTKETSLKNNKNWDDVLASFDIQNQDDNDLAFDDTNTSTSSDTQTTEYSSNRWATRAFVLFGCAVALGNVPLQSFLPNAPSNQFEITLESDTTEKTDIKPTTPSSDQRMEFQLASVSSNKVTATVAPAIVAKEVAPTEVTDQNTDLVTDVAEDIVELQLPSRALETYTGHQLVNTASVWHTYTVQRYDNTYNAFSQVKQKDLHSKLKKIEPIAEALKDMKLGTIVRAKSHNGKIEQLAFTPDNERTFVIEPDGEGSYKGEWQKKVFEVRQARATFSVKNGLFLDGKKVNVPSNITRQVVSVFDWDIDFSHDVRVGDQVRFAHDGHFLEGRVNRITRRATVLVPHAKGERFSDGGRYLRFYVPLEKLTRRT